MDVSADDKPYVIVIQLPRRKEKSKKHPHQRAHNVEPAKYQREIDYIDDADDDYDSHGDGYDDGELKVYQLDNNKVHIKVNHWLSVLTLWRA